VKRYHSVANFARQERGKAAFTLAPFAPRRRVISLRHRLGDGCSVIAMLPPHLLHALVAPPLTLGRCGGSSLA